MNMMVLLIAERLSGTEYVNFCIHRDVLLLPVLSERVAENATAKKGRREKKFHTYVLCLIMYCPSFGEVRAVMSLSCR
jgi:hypothetical protein